MTPDDPRHGTERGAATHKRDGEEVCPACLEGRRRAARRRGKLQRMGKGRRQPIGEVYESLVRLNETYSHQQIADWAGVHYSVVTRILKQGPTAVLDASNKVKLAGITPTPVVTPVGYMRRVQALHWLGYTSPMIADAAGLNKESIKKVRDRAPRSVKVETRGKIAAAYDRLCLTVPQGANRIERAEITKARERARANGYLPPLAWDDIDDPAERPNLRPLAHTPKTDVDEAVVLRVMAGERLPMTTAERTEVVARLRARGWSLNEIEMRTGIGKPERYTKGGAA